MVRESIELLVSAILADSMMWSFRFGRFDGGARRDNLLAISGFRSVVETTFLRKDKVSDLLHVL